MIKLISLVEYTDVEEKPIKSAIKNKEEIQILWGNGKIFLPKNIKTNSAKALKDLMSNPIAGIFNFRNNSVKFIFWDDWSDFKFVNKVKQFLQDMIRLKYITASWKLTIQNPKNTRLSLGGAKVNDLLNYDASYTKTIPFAFHGTSSYFIDDIKRKGIVPNIYLDDEHFNWDKGYTINSNKQIYLTIDYDRAKYYADHCVDHLKDNGIKSKPVVIRIKNLPVDNVIADDDIETNMGMLQLLNMIYHGKKDKTYISGIRQSGQLAYNGRIPPTMFDKII